MVEHNESILDERGREIEKHDPCKYSMSLARVLGSG